MSKTQKDEPKPMDPTTREQLVGEVAVTRERVCYAGKTLVKEFHELFPETPVEYGGYDGRNTALDVAFDLTVLDIPAERDLATALLELCRTDNRVDSVVASDEGQVLVAFHSNPRTQDLRDPFGIAEAFDILVEGEQQ